MTLQQMFSTAGVVLEKNWFFIIILLSLIQISPIKINPWSWIGGWFGKIFGVKALDEKVTKLEEKVDNVENKFDNLENKVVSLESKVDAIEEKMNGLDNKVDTVEDKIDLNQAITSRVRILRFGDELRRGIEHSKEAFDQVLESDIKDYSIYCDSHKDFENDKTVITTQIIRETYRKLYTEHKI